VIGTGHKQAIVTLVERKSGYAVLMKVNHKTSELVSAAVIKKLEPIIDRVKQSPLTPVRSTSAKRSKHGLKASISRSNTFDRVTRSITLTLKDSTERFALNGYLNIAGSI
jgi:hypothetical protein